MPHSTVMAPVDITAVLDRFATMLAFSGTAGTAGALELLVESLGLRSAALHGASDSGPGELLAVAGAVVRVLPTKDAATKAPTVVELPVRGVGGRELGWLTAVDVAPGVLPALRVSAAVLGLTLSYDNSGVLAEQLLATAEAERDELADDLHDGPVQDLIVARYAAELAIRTGGDATDPAEALQAALVGLRRALWQLRPRGADGLAAAVAALSERLVEAGRAPVVLLLLPGGDVLRASRAVAAYRLVQAAALPEGKTPVRVTLRGADGLIHVVVEAGVALREPERWQRRFRALGGQLTCLPGRLHLVLPAAAGLPASTGTMSPSKAAL